ncbi:MAG TPA: peptidoglycan recognition protein [Acidimicrobiales bacterium]|nr:peptidoglycan recognition protein [Acidimicrobiales bacterium]
MSPLSRRVVATLVGAVTIAAASVVAPVAMAWGAPEVRFAELAVPAPHTVSAPFAHITEPLVRVLTAPFELSHLGVRWTGSEDAAVEVRTAAEAGVWSPWQAVEVSHDLGDEDHGRVLSGLLRADGARLVQARAKGDATGVRVVAIDTVHGPRHLVRAVASRAGAEVAPPGVILRSQWGADEGMRRPTPPSFAPVTRLVVHHTVTPNDDPDPASTMRAMYAYHVRANGWDDIGYNFVVDGSGRVYEGRWARAYGAGEVPDGESLDGQGVVGAHAEGENVGSVGVAVMGTFTDRAPPAAAVESLQRVLAWKAERNEINPLGTTTWADGRVLPTIVGHRDVGSTSCPGDQLWARLGAIRQAVAGQVTLAAAAATPGYAVLARDGSIVTFGGAGAGLLGTLSPLLLSPAAAIASTPTGRGLWVLSETGRVLPAGDAQLLGSPEADGLLAPAGQAVAIESTPTGRGYWVADETGRVSAFGDAPNLGAARAGPVVGMARTPSGHGYWVAGADGTVSAHGDAPALGSAAGRRGPPIVAIAGAAGGRGYWLVAADGTVLPFGSARRLGGLPERRIGATIVDARRSTSGRGYYLLGADGAVYSFGDAAFFGAPTGGLRAGATGLAVP